VTFERFGDHFDLAGPEQGAGLGAANPVMELLDDLHADRLGKAGGLVEPRLDVARIVAAEIRQCDDSLGAAGELTVGVAIENAQDPCSSSSCSLKFTGRSG
jgi:hypothetical protein